MPPTGAPGPARRATLEPHSLSAVESDSMGGGDKPDIDDLYEVDIVQCQADGTEVWRKLLINSTILTWKDDL